MAKKLSPEEFINRAKKVHGNRYDYSKANYINSCTKIVIICREHGEFEQVPNSHLNGRGCVKCSYLIKSLHLMMGLEKFVRRAKKIHNDKYDYSNVNYVNNHTNVSIICLIHGEFKQSPKSHLMGCGCPKCAGVASPSIEQFVYKAKKTHDKKYIYSDVEYINARTKIIIFCLEHGKFKQTPADHLKGNGCPKCASVSNTKLFIDKAKKVHGCKYNYSKVVYINTYDKVIIICPKHGFFEQAPTSHLNGRGCPKCQNTVSKSSQLWLDNLSIPKKYREKSIKVGDTTYKLDAYDPINNIAYEFNGDFWHGNPEKFSPNDINPKTKTTYGELYEKTLKKENKLKVAGYNLVSVWESEYKEQKK